jgi:hypothetical protein
MSNHQSNARRLRLRGTLLGAMLVAGIPATAMAGPTIPFGEEGYVTISYALQLWSQYRGYTSPTDDGSSYDTFLRRNRLLFAGQYNDYVGFYAQLEAGNDDKLGNADKPVFYRDAYVTFDYKDSLRLIAGRFKNTFSRENLEACLEPLSIDRAEIIAYTPFGAEGGGSRDTGIAVWGNLAGGLAQYRFMVGDGRQGDNVVKDSPRLTARMHLSLLDPETDYGYLSNYLGTRSVLTFGVAYDYQADVAYANFPARTNPVDYKAWTADMLFEYPTRTGTYVLSAAYFDYDTDNAINASPDPTLPVTSQLKAYYVKGAYLLPHKVGIGRLQPYFRYENSDYGVNSGLFDQEWVGGGINYYIDGQNLRFTLEYARITFDQQSPTDPSLQDYSQATLAFQLIF